MDSALKEFPILGIKTDIEFLRDVVMHPEFLAGNTYTDFIPRNLPGWKPQVRPETLAEALTAAALQVEAEGRKGRGGKCGGRYRRGKRLVIGGSGDEFFSRGAALTRPMP